jgi:hypothetical protein
VIAGTAGSPSIENFKGFMLLSDVRDAVSIHSQI